MHRVTSRQRLFSWDHFDASPPSTEEHPHSHNHPHPQKHDQQKHNDDDQDAVKILDGHNHNFIFDYISNDNMHDNNDHNNNTTNGDGGVDVDGDVDVDVDDDQSDYKTCCMSRHGSMLFNQFSFGGGDDVNLNGNANGNAIVNAIVNNQNQDADRNSDATVEVKGTTQQSQHEHEHDFVNIISDVEDDDDDDDDDDNDNHDDDINDHDAEDDTQQFSSFGGTTTTANNNNNNNKSLSASPSPPASSVVPSTSTSTSTSKTTTIPSSSLFMTPSSSSLLLSCPSRSPSPSGESLSALTVPSMSSMSMSISKSMSQKNLYTYYPPKMNMNMNMNMVIQQKQKQKELNVLFHVNRDVQYHILSFLDLHSLRSTSLSCRYLYELLTEKQNDDNDNDDNDNNGGCARNAIWWNVMKRQWPFLPLGDHCDNDISLDEMTTIAVHQHQHQQEEKEDEDDEQQQQQRLVPFSPYMVEFTTTTTASSSSSKNEKTTSTTNTNNNNNNNNININYGTILTQSYPKHPPTKIDSSFFHPMPRNTQTQSIVNAADALVDLQVILARLERRDNENHDNENNHDNDNENHQIGDVVRRMRARTGARAGMRNKKCQLFTSYTMNVNTKELNSFSSNYLPSHEKEEMDLTLLESSTSSSALALSSALSSASSSSEENVMNSQSYCKFEVVQYIGRVGVGDRSIRSDEPFPRPLESLPIFKPERRAPSSSNAAAATMPLLTSSLSSSSSSSNNASGSTSTKFSRAENYTNPFMSRMGGRKRALPQEESTSPHAAASASSSSSLPCLPSPMNLFDRLRSCNRKSGTLEAVLNSSQRQHQNGNSRVMSSATSSMSTMFANGGYKSFLQRNSGGKFPFVSPMVTKSTHVYDGKCPKLKRYMEIDLTPRMMAYYEVSILPRDEEQEKTVSSTIETNRNDLVDDRDGGGDEIVESNTSSACVAIGLSMEKYSTSVRMPGWDEYSFGYHGDDGGIFHSRGDMIRVYGPRYNVGDTVGCGVNYVNGGIFFTLNGDFLGYAWCNEKVVLDGRVDLYPTVGVDSPNPLACNFGNERPFVWDFPKFMARNGS